MRIERTALLGNLDGFVNSGSGVIVGSPGAGKSYLLAELCVELERRNTTYLFLVIDVLGDVTEAELRQELKYGGLDLIESLADLSNPDRKAVLIIDGYDAARNERAQRNTLDLIRRARQDLKETWNVVVSVRTYDAKKSPQLLDLFGDGASAFGRQDPDIPCRHLVISEFDDQEISQLRDAAPSLIAIFDSATSDFKKVLRTPFHLWLLEKLLPHLGDLGQLAQVRSEIQLLRLFWQRRVSDGPYGFDREVVLRKLLNRMIADRSLSVLRADVYDSSLSERWYELLSNEVLMEASSFGQRVRFRHNILFDYAVSILAIDQHAHGPLKFLTEDRSRQLFLRPSLLYFFTRLWYEEREAFWINYQLIVASSEASIRLLGALLPPTVVVQEARAVGDLEPLLSALRDDAGGAPEAILRLLRAMQAWNTPYGSVWLDFLRRIASYVRWPFAWDLGLIATRFAQEIKASPSQQDFDQLGLIARGYMGWIWEQKTENKKSAWEAIGAQFGIGLVGQTYGTDVNASREALQPILSVAEEPTFSIQLIYRLVQQIDEIAPTDPEFALRIYVVVFSMEVKSEAKTLLGGGPVFAMTSTRRQDFQMCQYHLLEYFSAYIMLAPLIAIRTAIECIDRYVETEHVRRHLKPGFTTADVTQQFNFRGGVASFMQDGSFIWDQGHEHYAPTQMADHFENAVVKVSHSPSSLESILGLFRDGARSAFLWRRLLRIAGQIPERLIDPVYELCVAEPILTGLDTLYEIGQTLAVFGRRFSLTQREVVENSILALAAHCPDASTLNARLRTRDRLISQIPPECLVTEEAKAIRTELERTTGVPENRPLVTMTGGAREFTEDMWLASQGVDLASSANSQLRHDAEELTRALGSGARREKATVEIVEAAYPNAVRLHKTLEALPEADEALRVNCWTKLAQFANAAIVAMHGSPGEVSRFARQMLLLAATNPFPLSDPNEDEQFDSPVWSDAPRNEAALGLPLLLSHGADSEILDAVRALTRDPVPSVRYLVCHDLWRLVQVAPTEMWTLLADVASKENNAVVLQGVCESLWYLVAEDESHSTSVLSMVAPRVTEGPDHAELSRVFMALTMWLLIARKTPWAKRQSEQLMSASVQYALALNRATNAILTFIVPTRPSDEEANNRVQEAIHWALMFIEAAERGLVTVRTRGDGDKASEEDVESSFRNLYSVINQVITHLFFALDTQPNLRQRSDTASDPGQRKDLYNRTKPLLMRVLQFAEIPEAGMLAGPTAYHFIQLLRGVLSIDPEGVIEMAWRVVRCSQPHGFSLDALAIEEIVKLTESILADYRLQARQEQTLNHILDILDVFAETGWPQALRLVWRLDEVYR